MTSRQSLSVKFARSIQRLPLGWLRLFEKPFLLNANRAQLKMLCILALPRSGSTLTYQSLLHGFDTVYLSNLGNLLYQLPLIGGWISKIKCRSYSSNFYSEHGFVPGLCGPAEGLRFWSYWMGNHIDERVGESSDVRGRKEHLIKCFKRLGTAKRPILTGYLGHVLTASSLEEYFKGAVYIRLKRDPVRNALSILKARRKLDANWFSVFPMECNSVVNKSEHEQVAAQVYWLNKKLDEIAAEKRVYSLHYESLCADPNRELDKLRKYCLGYGYQLSLNKKLPSFFKREQDNIDSNVDAKLIGKYLSELEETHGALL